MIAAEQIERAISAIEESRETHVAWVDWIDALCCTCAECVATLEVAGNRTHHLRCVAKYDLVLSTLRGEPVAA